MLPAEKLVVKQFIEMWSYGGPTHLVRLLNLIDLVLESRV